MSIRERPASVEDLAVPGHWEGDLLFGGRNSQIATTRATVTAAVPAAPRKTKASIASTSAQAKSASKAPAKPAPKAVIESVSTATATSAKPKPKLVHDSFTIPKSEYAVLEGLKVRAANLTRPVKKCELLCAGVAVLNAMTDKAFLAALSGVPSLKTGRPKGNDAASVSDKGAK